jgi:hypothetical protein
MTDHGGAPAVYIRGVPHPLPEGEQLLWEGAPAADAVATHVFHRRALAVYFAVIMMWWMWSTTLAFGSSAFIAGLALRVGLAAIALGVVEMLSRVTARTAWYAVTNRRVVLKLGMVVPMSINLPFSRVQSVGVAVFRDGTGQVLLTLQKADRLAYIALWPHCRVFQFNHPQPLLRGLRDAHAVAALLAKAVEAASVEAAAVEAAAVEAAAVESTAVHASTLELRVPPQGALSVC